MIDIGKILKRAWHILWSYRILWIFGVLLAITAGSAGGSNSGITYQGGQERGQENWPQFLDRRWVDEMNYWFETNVEPLFATEAQAIHTLIWIGVGLLVFILVVSVVYALIRYPSETAVIRMVDGYEQTGTKLGFKQGWKLGWSRAAFRLWVIDLIISLPVLVLIGSLVGLGFAVYYSVESPSEFTAVTGSVAAVGCAFLLILLFALGLTFLHLLRQFFWREAALENTDIGDSFRRGWEMFKRNWQSGALMWLVMFGLGVALTIAGFILFFLLIPVLIFTALAGLIVAAIPGLLFGWIVSLFAPVWVAVVVGIVIAAPIFGLVTGSPFLLLNGWVKVFESSVWTLTYREFKALNTLAAPGTPAQIK